ncbi:MAG: peptidase domain-containing ABC transporter [Cyanobium sp. LacPavin_0920_WC12_MAG_63_22]|nr:peptidase domain-containing ABC transporter [Cyanobium sp. LacPavin_0920_WC12_MAG_63_22]
MRFEQLLRGSAPIANLPDQLISRMAAEASIQQLNVGQPFQRSGQLPPGAALLLEGRLRRLQLRPGEPPLSLGLASPGSWLGWSSLWRGEPELGLVASQPSTLLVVPALPALRLLQQEPELRHAVAGSPCLDELASLMEVWWRAQGQRPAQPQQQLEQLLAEALLLGPEDQLPPGHLLLYSGPRQPDGLLPGDQLQSDSEGWRALVNQLPPRVLAIPEAALNASLAPSTTAGIVPVAPAASLATTTDPIELGFVDSRPRPNGSGSATNPAADRVEQAFFCIQQLCQARELVVSSDQLLRNLRDVEERLGALKLPQVGLQLEALGFDTRPLRARAWELARLEPPAVLDFEGQFVLLLVAGRGSGVLISDPRRGPVRLGLDQLEQRCPDGLDVLVVREGRAGRNDVEKVGLGWFISAFGRYPGMVTMVVLTGFISQVLELVLPLSMMVVLDAVVIRNNPSLLAPILVLAVVATLVTGVIGGLRALVTADLSDRVDVRMGSSVVEHLLRLPLPYFESRQVGTILYNVNQLYAIRRFVVDQVLGAGLDLVLGLIMFVVLYIISPTLTLITVLAVPLLIGLNLFGAPLIERNLQISNRSLASANSYLVELLSGMRTVKSQNFEVEARWRWLDRYRRYTNSRFRLTRLSTLLGRAGRTIGGLSDVVLIGAAAGLMVTNQLSIGGFFVIRILSHRIINSFVQLGSLWQGVQELRLSLAALSQVMETLPEAGSSDQQQPPLPPLRGDLHFERVSFRYTPRSPYLLDGLDLSIKAGQFVGIVGLSGSGKSTLVQLIDRLYLPQKGTVLLDGNDVEKVQLASLRAQVGYVPQDGLLFEGTVLENLRLNSPDADMEAVIAATTAAAAHDFIRTLPNGYATRLGERGAGVSGGQRQRLCLARMVLQNPSLLILDEATSALDAETERQVFANLRQRFRGRTVLFITHRLTTLGDADRILFMEGGRIIEDGRHGELIRLGGSYATLYYQQVGIPAESSR